MGIEIIIVAFATIVLVATFLMLRALWLTWKMGDWMDRGE